MGDQEELVNIDRDHTADNQQWGVLLEVRRFFGALILSYY